MPRRINVPPMTKFNEWLLAQGVSESTACVYTNSVRSCVARMENVADDDGLQRYYAKRSPGAKAVIAAAWRRFRDYAAATGAFRIASLQAGTAEAPVEVCRALHVLVQVCELPIRAVAAARWSHVVVHSHSATFVSPLKVGRERTLPVVGANALRQIRTWAAPPDSDAPLIPAAPGGRAFRGAGRIREDIAAGISASLPPALQEPVKPQRNLGEPPPIESEEIAV